MYRTDRSTTHQAFRDQLASMVSEVKRDRKYLSENPDYSGLDSDIAYDLGYMNALTYAIKVEVQNTMAWGYEHDSLRKDVEQVKLLVVRLNERVS